MRSTATILTALLLALTTCGGVASATDFLRGDINNDGEVGMADAHALFSALFRGSPLWTCASAADVNDDGSVNLADGIVVLIHRVTDPVGMNPANPFPDVGPDPTPDELDCGEYGGGQALADSQAEIRVTTEPAAGGDDAGAVIRVHASSSRSLGAIYLRVATPGLAVARTTYSIDLTDTLETGFNGTGMDDDTISIGFLPSFIHDASFGPGDDVAVLEVGLCLAAGTPAGEYPIVVEAGELVDFASARAIVPTLVDGSLVVENDVSAQPSCPDDEPPPDSIGDIDAAIQLGDVNAAPGGSGSISVWIASNAPTNGFDISADFDEEHITLGDFVPTFERLDGAPWEFLASTVNNDNNTPGNDGLDEGYIAISAIVSSDDANAIPATQSQVGTLAFTLGEAPPTACLGVLLIDGAELDTGAGTRTVVNSLQSLGGTVTPENADSFVLDDARIRLGTGPTAERPEELNAEFRLPSINAVPGSSIMLPMSVLSNADVQGLSISIDFDEEILQATVVEELHIIPDGWAFFVYEINNDNATPGSAGVDEGFLYAAGVFSFVETFCVNMPANEENDAFGLHFDVAPDASGNSTEVAFLDGAHQPEGPGVQNVAVAFGETIEPSRANSFVFFDGVVNIAPDIAIFSRGDSNGDGVLNLSDAQRTLGYLFLGSQRPACFDAADANDDGKIEVTDAVRTLGHLFLGEPALPAPYPEPGEDPTDDALRCSIRLD